MEHKVVKHTFVSSAAKKSGHVFEFDLSEPIRNITAGRISGVVIKDFVGINNSYVYFIRTDGLYGTRSLTFFNRQPDYISFAIDNPGTVGALSIKRFDDTGNFYQTNCHNVWGIQFTLVDVNGLPVDPSDLGWSFTVELEFKINS